MVNKAKIKQALQVAIDKYEFTGIDFMDYLTMAKKSKNGNDFGERIVQYHKDRDEVLDTDAEDDIFTFANNVFDQITESSLNSDILSLSEFMNEARSPEQRAARNARRKAKRGGTAAVLQRDEDDEDDEEFDRLERDEKARNRGSDEFDYDEDAVEKNFKPSKSLTGAAESLRNETIKYQNLQKDFISTPKDNVAKREILKKKLIAQYKVMNKAQAAFDAIVGFEDDGFPDELYDSYNFEGFDIKGILNEDKTFIWTEFTEKDINVIKDEVNKYKLKATDIQLKGPVGMEVNSVKISGERKNIIKFLTDPWNGLDLDEVKDFYPELFESSITEKRDFNKDFRKLVKTLKDEGIDKEILKDVIDDIYIGY